MPTRIPRTTYADMSGPTTGDLLQLNSRGQWVNVSVLDEGIWT